MNLINNEDNYENENLKEDDQDMKVHKDQELDFSEKGKFRYTHHF